MSLHELSLIIPVLNEEKNVPLLYEELYSILTTLKKSYEVIFVDDGSTDRTLDAIKKISQNDPHVKYISFRKNFQKAAALSAGFEYASGSVIITMDGDLQEDPQDPEKFLEKIKHADVVVGWKYHRRGPFFRKTSSKIFNFLIMVLLGLKIHDNDCNYRAMRREVLEHINVYSGLYRYIPVLAAARGYRVEEVIVHHRPRRYGKSKYGMRRLFWGILDLFTIKFLISYTRKPLHLFGLLGAISFGFGFILGVYLLYVKFVGLENISGRPLLLLALLLLVLGVQFFSLGLIGELITSSHELRDNYVIAEKNI